MGELYCTLFEMWCSDVEEDDLAEFCCDLDCENCGESSVIGG